MSDAPLSHDANHDAHHDATHDAHQDVVVGSGPAGVAAAWARLAKGRRVTLVDVGTALEPERAALRDRLAARTPEQWDAADIDMIQAPRHQEHTDSMMPFGSRFVFADALGVGARLSDPALALKPSFALGGLSNGWGAAVLPYRQEDIHDWPLSAEDLAPHYNAIQEFVPVASRPDDLCTVFPSYAIDKDTSLPPTTQAAKLLRKLGRHAGKLAKRGVVAGQARQAVAPGCRTCAMCLHGCPYGLIFNAAHVVARLQQHPSFRYVPGRLVRRFQEHDKGVTLWTEDVATNSVVELEAERVFLGAGVLSSTYLTLHSLQITDTAVPLRDSQHFFLPMLQRWWPVPDPADEARHTLTQAFVEILDPAIDRHSVHAQIYTYNDLYASDMRRRFGPLADPLQPLIQHLSRRLIVAQGFLHSAVSSRVDIRLAKSTATSRLTFDIRPHPATRTIVDRAVRKLSYVGRVGGLVPLQPLVRLGDVGSSYHCGGTFPMRRQPLDLETDVLGRPNGLGRVHLVDASVFPTIPATTITLSVMANAHRIGTLA